MLTATSLAARESALDFLLTPQSIAVLEKVMMPAHVAVPTRRRRQWARLRTLLRQ
ncbi:MAG TPA: hypothetical protein VGJ18_17975 [Gemmatimonadaceae bacterium]